ncbi:homoserine dehydrogenase [Leeia sp. TBRC 13508]|uniref:homoserine dehydrogenase n=1 Tax=Leeia speluncae TaxID=2884804 RepID=A0ABS8DAX7_9NEIS|nr:homoserine dehydrogenase [Leeia speluncae]MCB6185370.1 homoserine dehydrogenase [Leeia speluncae]
MKLKLALLGFGGVNHGLAEVIQLKQKLLKEKFNLELVITAVSDMRFGTVWNENGLDLKSLIALPTVGYAIDALKQQAGTYHGGSSLEETLAMIQLNCVDAVLEATFTNPQTGEPAISHCKTALSAGKHVITTNKGPVALALTELRQIAKEYRAKFYYEGAVMSGTPVLRQLDMTLRGCEIERFSGILNGTCNYVLGQVEAGMSMADAIAEAQRLGYAEADPTADVGGFDVMLKVCILANAIWDADLKPTDISREGITGLTETEILNARKEGFAWRLIGEASRNAAGVITGSVKPQRIPASDPLLGANGANNSVTFTTDLLGAVTIAGPGAGRHETAFALLSDLIELNDRLSK